MLATAGGKALLAERRMRIARRICVAGAKDEAELVDQFLEQYQACRMR
jgi:hypothetical protein